MAQSLTKSSSALVAANGTLEEAVALTAAANTTIQDADVVGTALKTISMRLRGTSLSEMEEDGLETEGYTTQSKLRGTVKSVTGIDILTDTGAYKSTYQILAEIAEVWDDITDDQAKAGLLEALAGKRSGSVVAAILQNPDVLKDAFESAKGAQGSAQAELEKYMDSIQGRLDQFTNSLQTMWNNVLDDDLVKFIVQAGTELVKFIDNLGVVKTLVIGIGTYLIQKNFKGDLFGGLFNAETVDQARERLKNLQGEIEALQKKGKSPKKIEHKQNQANTLKASIDKYDELSKQLTKNRIDADAAKKALDDYNESLAKKYSQKENQGKSATAEETAEVERLQKAYNGANDEVVKTEVALKQAEVQAKATGTAGLNAGNKIKTGFVSAGKAIWKFAKEMAMSMAYTMAFTAIFEAIGNIGEGLAPLFKNMDKSAEALQDKLSELENELSSVESELSNLKSELKDTDERIEELMSQGTLTFVEQEELNKLKSVSAELKSQIELQENLRKSMQQGVNSASIDATNAYLDTSFMSEKSQTEKQEEAKEIGSSIGQIAGTIIGGIVGTVIGGGITLASGGTAAVPGAAIGIAAGSAVTSWLVGEAASAAAGAAYDSEQTVGEAMDSMLETRAKLKEEQDKALAENDAEAYNEATEALRTYDSQMAKHISQIQQNYNAMDWELADPETRKEMMEYADWLDKYNISMGTAGAKSNAIARIFGDEASDELKEIKKRMEETTEAGEEISLADAFNGDEEAYNAFKTRLYDIGLTVYETEQYFKDQKKAADEAINSIETYDAIKQIQKLTGGVNDLKNAFKELHEEGLVSAETLLGLEDVFGDTEGWDEFFETMSSGTATMEEAEASAKTLAENYVDGLLSSGKYSAKEYVAYISHLQSLGITNAKDFLDAKLKKNMATDIAQRVKNGTSESDAIKTVEEEYGIKLDGENDRLLVEKAITAEKAKQEASDKQAAKNAYDVAVTNHNVAKEKNQAIDDEINSLSGKSTSDLQGSYGVGQIGYTDGQVPRPYVKYNGKTYYLNYDGSPTQELRDAIAANLAGQKVEVPSLPAEVTEIDVANANNAATEATNDLQTELDKHGLTLEINLIDKNELIDEAQNIYDTLANAAKEYGESGYVSVDTLQSLLQLEPKYLALLYDENGQLNLNKDTMYQLTVARVTDMGIQQAQQVIETARTALLDGNIEKLRELTEVTYGQATSNWDLVKSNLALLKTEMADKGVDSSIYDGIESQVLAIQELTNTTIANIGNTISSSGNTAAAEVEDAFQKEMDYWENRIAANQSKYEQLQNEIDLLEAKGQKADASFYEEQINLENERLWLLGEQKKAAQAHLKTLKEGSEEWWEVAGVLNDLESDIDDVTASIVDLQDAIAEIDIYRFEEFGTRLDNLISKLDTLRNLIAPDGEEDWFDDEGSWTEAGVAVLGSQLQALEMYKQGYQETMDELAKYEPDYESNKAYYEALGIHSEQEWYEKTEELISQQYDFAESISDTEQSVVDMYESSIDAIEEYTSTLVDSYNDYIDSVKEALDAERDLYNFKKNVQKQTKDIAALERRIASLSGSTSASDIAERRRLEADLYGAREELDDTYYEHAKDSQSEALDREAEAYEESMNNMIEGLRTSLEEATLNMDEFLMGVTSMVMYNADTVLAKYQETNLPLTTELTNPWLKAQEAVGAYSGDALALMDQWTKGGGFFAQFSTTGTTSLQSPWSAGTSAAGAFATSVGTAMAGVVSNIESNVKKAKNSLASLTTDIKDTTLMADGTTSDKYVPSNPPATKKYRYTASIPGFVGKGAEKNSVAEAQTNAQEALYKVFEAKKKKDGVDPSLIYSEFLKAKKRAGGVKFAAYAKGTLGTARDEWAITDESWIGEEITLAAGKNGQLQYLKKGSAVMPADISANLIEWGKLNPNMMSTGAAPNINMISNAINKPEFNFNVDNFLRCDNVSQDTLPELKQFVKTEMNNLIKQMNYAIKGKGGR